MITVDRKNSFNEIKDLWSELYHDKNEKTYYQSPEYMQVSWDNLFPYRFILRIKPIFFVFSQDSRVIFILPLFKYMCKNRYTLYGKKAGFGYLDGAYRKDITEDDFMECFEKLREYLKTAAIDIRQVRACTPLGKWLLSRGCHLGEEGYTTINLPGEYDDYFPSLSKHMRQNIRTSYNRLKTDGGTFELICCGYKTMPDDLRDALQKLYLNRQVEKYGKSILYKYFVKYVDLGTKIQRTDKIEEKAFILYIDGKVAAFYDAIYDADTVLVPRLAISEDFERYSPGVMLINESIKILINEKKRCLDLTHGTEKYKLSMGGEIYNCVEGSLSF